jgi:hypothetical protein
MMAHLALRARTSYAQKRDFSAGGFLAKKRAFSHSRGAAGLLAGWAGAVPLTLSGRT